MSFSGDVKKEIAEHKINKPCCIVAACYAIACFGKYFDDKGVILHTEKAFVAKFAKYMYERIGISGKIFVKGTENMPIYEFAIKQAEDVTRLLQTFGHTGKETALHINEDIFKCDNCYSSFFAAAFLCTGIVTNPKSDYNLEFTCNRQGRILDLQKLLQECEFNFKHIVRNGTQVLYIKSSTQIEDLLTTIGAPNASLEIMKFKIYRDFRNKANRMANCETANIGKIINANQTSIDAIKFLQQENALDYLTEDLKNTALMRLSNEEMSLADLAKIIKPTVSKSGLSHRFKKIEKIANEMKQKKETKENV